MNFEITFLNHFAAFVAVVIIIVAIARVPVCVQR